MNRTVRNVGGLILSIILMISMYGVYKGGTTNVGNQAFGAMHRLAGNAFNKVKGVDTSLPWNQDDYDGSIQENNRAYKYWQKQAGEIHLGNEADSAWSDSPYNYKSWNQHGEYKYKDISKDSPASVIDYSRPYKVPSQGNEVYFYAKGDTTTPQSTGSVAISPNTPVKNDGMGDLAVK